MLLLKIQAVKIRALKFMKCFLNCRVINKMALHFLHIVVLFSIGLSPLLAAATDYTTVILEQDQNHLKIKFTFDLPGSAYIDGETYATYKKASYIQDDNGAKIPLLNEIIHLPGKYAEIKILSHSEATQSISNYFSYF